MSAFGGKADMPQCPLFPRKRTLFIGFRCPLCAKSRHSNDFWILLSVGKGAQVRGASPVKIPRRNFLHLAVASALPAVSRIARAQTYPSRPVRLIVPLAPAGASDITARLIGQWLSERSASNLLSTTARVAAA